MGCLTADCCSKALGGTGDQLANAGATGRFFIELSQPPRNGRLAGAVMPGVRPGGRDSGNAAMRRGLRKCIHATQTPPEWLQ
ncbi:hypothetical protein [Roseateles sp.]|uniref:hypothetical protein n=1 Tax=Roseateles sp. TaxID=1971397 RepID=UPI0040365342